jgi:hypothetical protein
MLLSYHTLLGQSPIGNWKIISHISEHKGEKFDSHSELAKAKPCINSIVYEIKNDNSIILKTNTCNCEQSYKSIQQKLWSNTKWRIEGNKISTSNSNFAASNTYIISYTGNKMIWKGLEGQGTITYQKQ